MTHAVAHEPSNIQVESLSAPQLFSSLVSFFPGLINIMLCRDHFGSLGFPPSQLAFVNLFDGLGISICIVPLWRVSLVVTHPPFNALDLGIGCNMLNSRGNFPMQTFHIFFGYETQ